MDEKESLEKILDNTITEEKSDKLEYSIPISKNPREGRSSSMFKMFIESIRGYPGTIETVNFKSKLVKFSAILTTRSSLYKLLIILFASLVMSLITLFFIKNPGLYSTGINGIFQGIARITKTRMLIDNKIDRSTIEIIYNVIFWMMNIVFNIPLVIFAYKKVSKNFAILTIFYVVFAQLFGLCLDYIPGIQDVMIFGRVSLDTTNLSQNNINLINDTGLSFIKWNQHDVINLFIYAVTAGGLFGLVMSFLVMIGSSTGGTDVFSFYFAKRKNKSIGFTLMIINNICLITSTIIGSLCSLLIIDSTIMTEFVDPQSVASSVIQTILSPNLLFSGLMAIISGLVVDFLFPKSKFVQIKMYTKDVNTLKHKLLLVGYKHNFYINEVGDPLNESNEFVLETICMYIELPSLLSTIRAVDNDALITINKLSDLDGKMNVIK